MVHKSGIPDGVGVTVASILLSALATAGLEPALEADSTEDTPAISFVDPDTRQRHHVRVEGASREIQLGALEYLYWQPPYPRLGPVGTSLATHAQVPCAVCGQSLSDGRPTRLIVLGLETALDKERHRRGQPCTALCIRAHHECTGADT